MYNLLFAASSALMHTEYAQQGELYSYCMLPSNISISMVMISVSDSCSVMADNSLQQERGHGYTSQSPYKPQNMSCLLVR